MVNSYRLTNVANRKGYVWGMENLKEKEYYKDKIAELVEKIENPATLKFILSVIESYLKSRGV